MKHSKLDYALNIFIALTVIGAIVNKLSLWVTGIALVWSGVCYIADKPYDFSLAIAGYAFVVFIITFILFLATLVWLKK